MENKSHVPNHQPDINLVDAIYGHMIPSVDHLLEKYRKTTRCPLKLRKVFTQSLRRPSGTPSHGNLALLEMEISWKCVYWYHDFHLGPLNPC